MSPHTNISRACTHANGDFTRTFKDRSRNEVVQQRMRHHAGRHRNDVVRFVCTETKIARAIAHHAHCCATCIFCESTQLRINLKTCCACIRLSHNGQLGLTLNAALNVLPIASTATLCHVLTRRNATVLAWLGDGQQLSTAKVVLLLRQFNLHQLAFDDARNEHHATIIHAG